MGQFKGFGTILKISPSPVNPLGTEDEYTRPTDKRKLTFFTIDVMYEICVNTCTVRLIFRQGRVQLPVPWIDHLAKACSRPIGREQAFCAKHSFYSSTKYNISWKQPLFMISLSHVRMAEGFSLLTSVTSHCGRLGFESHH